MASATSPSAVSKFSRQLVGEHVLVECGADVPVVAGAVGELEDVVVAGDPFRDVMTSRSSMLMRASPPSLVAAAAGRPEPAARRRASSMLTPSC